MHEKRKKNIESPVHQKSHAYSWNTFYVGWFGCEFHQNHQTSSAFSHTYMNCELSTPTCVTLYCSEENNNNIPSTIIPRQLTMNKITSNKSSLSNCILNMKNVTMKPKVTVIAHISLQLIVCEVLIILNSCGKTIYIFALASNSMSRESDKKCIQRCTIYHIVASSSYPEYNSKETFSLHLWIAFVE